MVKLQLLFHLTFRLLSFSGFWFIKLSYCLASVDPFLCLLPFLSTLLSFSPMWFLTPSPASTTLQFLPHMNKKT